MVQLSNILTIVVAGSSIATASYNKRSTKASAQADAQAAAANFQNILTMFSNSIATGDTLDASDLKSAVQGYVGMISTISKLGTANEGNSTGFTPNWEGAVIGAVINSHIGLLTGALMGVTTTWSYKGLNDGLTSILGFDPMQALNGVAGDLPAGLPAGLPGGLPSLPNPIVPAVAPAPKSPVAAPAPAPKPVVAAPAPKPVVAAPPVAPVAAPKPPVPATPQAPTSAAAPKVAQPPAAPMPGMAGMSGHGHGGWIDTAYTQKRK